MKIDSLFFEITNKCNKHCVYCYNKENAVNLPKNNYLDKKILYKSIDEAVMMGARSITLSGGEPTLYPGFCNVVDYIIRNGISCKVNSNVHDKDILIEVSRKWGEKVYFQFTLDGGARVHDSLRGEGDYKHILSSVISMRESGYDGVISVRYNLHPSNFNSLDIINTYNDIGGYVDYIYISPIIGEIESRISAENYITVLNMVNNIKHSKKSEVILFTPPLSCTLMHINQSTLLSPLIDVFGNIYLCQMALYKKIFCIGNLYNDSLRNVLSDQNVINATDSVKKGINCNKQCSIKRFCDGGCKGICSDNDGDGYCELRKTGLMKNIKIKKYQCW